MPNSTRWPLPDFTERQKKRYDEAWGIALAQAGGVNKLSTALSNHSGAGYISHQAIRNWRRNYRIPPDWALIVERYTGGNASFFDLVPWLRERFKHKQEAA